MNRLWRAVAILVGAVFVYTGAIKIADPIGFAGDIENYHILPWALSARLAFYLPWLELLCGIALIVSRLRTGAIAILSALMLIFIAAAVAAKARGIDITCGCFGHVSDQLSFAWHLVLDFVILGALVFSLSHEVSSTPNER
ncbi:MAG TPA: MauE/DoxX family redox-associated membrane protein [Chthoniobacterales bacterium]|nr:MauE/DoxX family redox-associated membrane protein [Chthoniobacterales bacterium]